MLVSAILVYVLIGPNIVTVALAVIGTLGAFAKSGLEHWQRWQVARSRISNSER
jgi:hypothetical protein